MASLSETLALYILQPFHQLLQGNQEFKWSPRCEEAFKKAKDSLSSSNVLVHYDPSLPVILESDASQYGIGAIIFHRFPNGDERPNAYATRSLNLSEKNYSQIEKEGFAIIFGVTKFNGKTSHRAWLPSCAQLSKITLMFSNQASELSKESQPN